MSEEVQEEATVDNTVSYICYQCGKDSRLPPGPLPNGWLLGPSGYELITLVDDHIPPRTVIALCSGGCRSSFKAHADERLQQRKYRGKSSS